MSQNACLKKYLLLVVICLHDTLRPESSAKLISTIDCSTRAKKNKQTRTRIAFVCQEFTVVFKMKEKQTCDTKCYFCISHKPKHAYKIAVKCLSFDYVRLHIN